MGCQTVPGSPREPAPQAAPITVVGGVLRRGRLGSLGGHGCGCVRFDCELALSTLPAQSFGLVQLAA